MRQKFLITENERIRIRAMYGLITEDIDPNDGGTLNMTNYYKPGYYTLDSIDTKTNKPIKESLNNELSKVLNFLKNNPNSIVKVKFLAQESAIPNSDNEGEIGGGPLEIGELSETRKKYLQMYINRYFNSFKSDGTISQEVQIPPIEYERLETVTPWVGTPFCPENSTLEQQRSFCVKKYKEGVRNNNPEVMDFKRKYDSEQRTELTITVSKVTTPTTTIKEVCKIGLTIRIYVEKHSCQNAEFFVFANNTLLYNSKGGMTANLNNINTERGIPGMYVEPKFQPELLNPGYGYLKNGDGTLGSYSYGSINEDGDLGNGRSDTFIITKEQSETILSQGGGLLNLWMICTTTSAHQDIPKVVITKEGEQTPLYDGSPNVIQGLILTLDPCTGKVTNGRESSIPDNSSYVQKLKDERIQIFSQSLESKINSLDERDRKRYQLDTKGILLERVYDLNNKMRNFITSLKGYATNKNNFVKGSEVANKIQNSYSEFYNELAKEPSLLKTNNKYVNRVIDSEYYGDVRMTMKEFYQQFDELYLSPTGEYSATAKNPITIYNSLVRRK